MELMVAIIQRDIIITNYDTLATENNKSFMYGRSINKQVCQLSDIKSGYTSFLC